MTLVWPGAFLASMFAEHPSTHLKAPVGTGSSALLKRRLSQPAAAMLVVVLIGFHGFPDCLPHDDQLLLPQLRPLPPGLATQRMSLLLVTVLNDTAAARRLAS